MKTRTFGSRVWVGTDAVLQWQEAQQNFVLSFAASTQRLVSVRPTLTLPTGVSLPNVAVTSLHSDTTSDVRASPAPTLLLAEDAGGTVLLGLANMDGGLLGESQGEVGVSIGSTAVVLVALAAGYPLPDVDRDLVDQILAHPQWPALTTALSRLLQADPNFLDRLFDHPAVVAQIRTIGTSLSGTTSADVPRQSAPAPMFAAASDSVLPDGERHDDFWSGSPWAAAAPWIWYGEAHPSVLPTPPFLAASEARRGLTATGNPNFVDYALEVYTENGYLDWYYVPGNPSLAAKLLNSYAAYRPIPLTSEITRVEFTRYRLSGSSTRAAALSFMNTFKMVLSTVSLLVQIDGAKKVLQRLNVKQEYRGIAACATPLLTGLTPPSPPDGELARYMVEFVADNILNVHQALLSCTVLHGKKGYEKAGALEEALTGALVQTLISLTPVAWVRIIGKAVNEVVPITTSYLLPGAGSVDYHLLWNTSGGPDELCTVSETPFPRPEPPTNLRETEVTEDSITIAWDPPDGAPTEATYIVSYSNGKTGPQTLDTSATAYTLSGLDADTEYKITVAMEAQECSIHGGGAAHLQVRTLKEETGQTDGRAVLRAVSVTTKSMTIEGPRSPLPGVKYYWTFFTFGSDRQTSTPKLTVTGITPGGVVGGSLAVCRPDQRKSGRCQNTNDEEPPVGFYPFEFPTMLPEKFYNKVCMIRPPEAYPLRQSSSLSTLVDIPPPYCMYRGHSRWLIVKKLQSEFYDYLKPHGDCDPAYWQDLINNDPDYAEDIRGEAREALANCARVAQVVREWIAAPYGCAQTTVPEHGRTALADDRPPSPYYGEAEVLEEFSSADKCIQAGGWWAGRGWAGGEGGIGRGRREWHCGSDCLE